MTPTFQYQLYDRRGSQIKLALDGAIKSRFAEGNLQKVYVTDEMKARVSDLIEICHQNMNKDLELELEEEIHLMETMTEDEDTKTLEYHYDLYETTKTFNDFLCIIFLNLANILTYPNETFYEKI